MSLEQDIKSLQAGFDKRGSFKTLENLVSLRLRSISSSLNEINYEDLKALNELLKKLDRD